jgi:hypothetical protein
VGRGGWANERANRSRSNPARGVRRVRASGSVSPMLVQTTTGRTLLEAQENLTFHRERHACTGGALFIFLHPWLTKAKVTNC